MLVTTQSTLALRCADCGRLEVHHLSLFDFAGGRTVRLTCSCGAHKLTIGQKGHQVWLRFPCLLCGSTHFLYFPRAAFWAPELKRITCPEAGMDVGFFGLDREPPEPLEPADEVRLDLGRQALSEQPGGAQELMEEAGFDDYFDNPQVMYEMLNRLHDLAAGGKLHCPCGNAQVQVEVLPDRIELTCPSCGRWRSLEAESDQDLARLDQFEGADQGAQGWRERDARGGGSLHHNQRQI